MASNREAATPVAAEVEAEESPEEMKMPPLPDAKPDTSRPLPASTKIVSDAPPKVTSAPIEVVPIRDGFYRGSRYKAGGKPFLVYGGMEKVGSWMRCTKPQLEDEHQRYMKARKKKNQAGI